MKKLLPVFLSLIVLSQAMVNVGIATYYHLNKTYITQQHCENKSKPAMQCNGHCYLSKQLKKAQETEKKQAHSILKEKDELVSAHKVLTLAKFFPAFKTISIPHFNSNAPLAVSAPPLLKPPVVLV